jgi:DNA-binding transcriptional LysR family regulator
MDRITAMRVYVETAERGNLSAAALQMEMSRAMASRYLQSMERWAGARLMHRSTRRLSLTPAGQRLLVLCREMLGLTAQVDRLAAESEEEPHGQLRMTASGIFSQTQLTPAVVAFLARHPKATVDLQVLDRTVNLIEERIDLAIRITGELDPNLIARRIGNCRSVICAAPTYLQEHGVPQQARDLMGHNCLHYAYFGQSLWQFTHQGEPVGVPIQGNFSANDSVTLLRATVAGGGIAMLPTFAIGDEIRSGQLVELLADHTIAQMGIHAVYVSRQYQSVLMREMIDFLAQRFDDNKTLGVT